MIGSISHGLHIRDNIVDDDDDDDEELSGHLEMQTILYQKNPLHDFNNNVTNKDND